MSGIFDKYLSMINGSRSATYSHSMPNTGKYVQTVDGNAVYVPYTKNRRSSSVSSEGSIVSGLGGGSSRNSSVSSGTVDPAVIEEMETKQVKMVKTAPNNRVNF